MMECLDHLAGQPSDFVGLADAALLVDGRRLPVHSAVLSMHSAWFRTLFASLKDGLATNCGGDLTLRDHFKDLDLEDFCSLLRCIYSPNPATVQAELVHIREEGGEVFFDYRVERLLALAHQFDMTLLFDLVEQVVSEEPRCRLALLMDPLRWLLVCDEYQHLGHLAKLRSTAISFLTAKFSALQTDPRLERLSPPTLTEVVRMAGYRLSTLAASCGHVQAVQDRAAQRFTATAQQVASEYCPDVSEAASFVTHWWLNPSSNCIKLSWSRRSEADMHLQPPAQQAEQALAQQAQQGALEQAAAEAEGAHMQAQQHLPQQAQHAAALELPHAAQQAQQAQQGLPPPFVGADLAGWAQAAVLQQALGQVAFMQQQQAAAADEWGEEAALAEAEAADMMEELGPLIQAAAVFLPAQQQPQQPAGAAAPMAAGAAPAVAPGVGQNGAAAVAEGAGGLPLPLLPGLQGAAQALLTHGRQGPLGAGIALRGQQAGQQAAGQRHQHHHQRAAGKLRFHPY